MKIEGKRIVLTGAASGIGRALLDQLATYSVQLMVVDLNEEALHEAVQAQAGKAASIHQMTANLMEQAQIDVVIDGAVAAFGGIDLFIANAGFAYYEKLEAADWGHIEKIFQLNTFSPIYTALRMRALNPNRPHHMVILASAMAHLNLPGYALYGATKAALDRFADAYRFELEPESKLTLVYPIATRTRFFKAANIGTPMPWPSQTPETVAAAILRGIERDHKQVHPSMVYRVTSVIFRLIPWSGRLYQLWQNRLFQGWLKR